MLSNNIVRETLYYNNFIINNYYCVNMEIMLRNIM